MAQFGGCDDRYNGAGDSNIKGQNNMKNIMIIATLLASIGLTGCATAQFSHSTSEGGETTFSYTRIGKQELTGVRGEAPNGWLFTLEKQQSQTVDIDELIDKIKE